MRTEYTCVLRMYQKNKWLSRRRHVKLVPDCTQSVEIHPTMNLSEEETHLRLKQSLVWLEDLK